MTTSDYFVILVRKSIDRFHHNALFSNELIAAFAHRNWRGKVLDYIEEPKAILHALQDPYCKFFLAFNGFGTELKVTTTDPGRLYSAFEEYRKPVLDLMHDCPLHETMAHQLDSTHTARKLFITDYRYAEMALDLGVKNVTFVSSIVFPHTFKSFSRSKQRDIDVLFAVGLSLPGDVQNRYDSSRFKSRIFSTIFDEVTEKCGREWPRDPAVELKATMRDLGIWFDCSDFDHRFLLTTVLDFVKFDRRQRMLTAANDLPITLISDQEISQNKQRKGMTFLKQRSATDILKLMAQSKIVLCPTTHMTGYHERPLGAFSAGAAVISAPCAPLEAHFSHGRDVFFYSNMDEMRKYLEILLADRSLISGVGEAGKITANRFFPPKLLVDTMLNSMRTWPSP